MILKASVSCPKCGGEPTAGPGESIAQAISRLALACRCGWSGTATLTLCGTAKGRLDHKAARVA